MAKKTTPADKIKPATWGKLRTWISDRLGEMEPDAASVNEEEGRDFLPALRGLRDECAKRAGQ